MNFTKKDMANFLNNKKVAQSKFIALRRANLGYWKTVTTKEYNKRIGNYTSIRSIVYFTPDEIIEWFEHKINKHKSNAFTAVNQMYLRNWNEMIYIAKHFKSIN